MARLVMKPFIASDYEGSNVHNGEFFVAPDASLMYRGNDGLPYEAAKVTRGANLIYDGLGTGPTLPGRFTSNVSLVNTGSDILKGVYRNAVKLTPRVYCIFDVVPIDPRRTYRWSYLVRNGSDSTNTRNRIYAGLANVEFFNDHNQRSPYGRMAASPNYMRVVGTETTLTQPLLPTDNIIHVANLSEGWGYTPNADHLNGITVTGIPDYRGVVQPDWSFQSKFAQYIFNAKTIFDRKNNRIILDRPIGAWFPDGLPNGSKIARSNSGSWLPYSSIVGEFVDRRPNDANGNPVYGTNWERRTNYHGFWDSFCNGSETRSGDVGHFVDATGHLTGHFSRSATHAALFMFDNYESKMQPSDTYVAQMELVEMPWIRVMFKKNLPTADGFVAGDLAYCTELGAMMIRTGRADDAYNFNGWAKLNGETI